MGRIQFGWAPRISFEVTDMKYSGMIGFIEFKETSPSVWTEKVTERPYYGDVLKFNRRTRETQHLNDDVMTISNTISIVADPYALNNLQSIRYVTWMNSKWKISNVEVAYPRLNLEIGGVYNGEE